MSKSYLGEVFDIHGGGLDLIFPHHENELAQSRCAHGTKKMANIWMHNGFLQVEGQKMSKSLGNFVTINELMTTERFGQRRWSGSALRLAMIGTHYRQPIDWTVSTLDQAASELQAIAKTLVSNEAWQVSTYYSKKVAAPNEAVLNALEDDFNTPKAISELRNMHSRAKTGDRSANLELIQSCEFLGLLRGDRLNALFPYHVRTGARMASPKQTRFLDDLQLAFLNEDVILQQHIKDELVKEGVTAEVLENGTLNYTVSSSADVSLQVEALISARLQARKAKNWGESDRIRDELAAMGVSIKDNKDGTTSWEVKR